MKSSHITQLPSNPILLITALTSFLNVCTYSHATDDWLTDWLTEWGQSVKSFCPVICKDNVVAFPNTQQRGPDLLPKHAYRSNIWEQNVTLGPSRAAWNCYSDSTDNRPRGTWGERTFSFLLSTCQFNCQDMDTEEDFSNSEEIGNTGTTIRGPLRITLLIFLYYRCFVFQHLTEKRVNIPLFLPYLYLCGKDQMCLL